MTSSEIRFFRLKLSGDAFWLADVRKLATQVPKVQCRKKLNQRMTWNQMATMSQTITNSCPQMIPKSRQMTTKISNSIPTQSQVSYSTTLYPPKTSPMTDNSST